MSALPTYKVEAAFNAGVNTPAASRTWTDVTAYALLEPGIDIDHGRGDWRSAADANTVRTTLNNSDGRFTAGLASSPYYPNVKIGRPIRVTATTDPGSVNLLSANAASVETSIADWTAAGSPLPVLSQSSVRAFDGTKSLLITWQGGGGFPQAQATVTGLTIGQTYTFSAFVYIPAGSNDVVAIFATASGPQVSARDGWVRTSVSFTATATSHGVAIRGIAPTIGNTCWADAFMVNLGAQAADFNMLAQATTRYLGFVDEWPVEWPATVSTFATASISATSRLAWLGNTVELKSIVEEEFLVDDPVAYYTLAEPAGAVAANDSSGAIQPTTLTQVGSGTAVVFGNATGPGTDSLTAATFNGSTTTGKVLTASLAATPELIEAFALATSAGAQPVGVLGLRNPSTGAQVMLTLTTGQLSVVRDDGSGHVGPTFSTDVTHHVAWNTATGTYYLDGAATASSVTVGAGYTQLMVGGPVAPSVEDWYHLNGVMAHVATFSTAPSSTRILAHANAGLNGFAGETPAARLTRYASYAGIAASELSLETGMVPDLAHVDTTGVTALEMMRKVETTEEGVLFDAQDGTLTFHARNHRYSAASAFTLDVAARQVAIGISPRLDRSAMRNDVTATSTDGTIAARAKNDASIADYGIARESLDVATTNAEEPFQHASWLVGQYGTPQPRVPQLGVRLANLPTALQMAVLNAGVGTRFTVRNMPSQAAVTTQDYYIEGYTESIGPGYHDFVFNVSQAEPFDVWTVEDPVFGQYDAYPIAL